MMDANATQTPQNTPLTASQVLDTPGSPAKTLAAGVPNAQTTTETPPKTENVSGKLQLLIQRERSAIERERTAAAKEHAIAAREAKITEFESLKQTNPLKALELLGLDYSALSQVFMADGNIPPEVQIKKVHEELNSLKKAQEDEKRAQQEASQKQLEQRLAETTANFKNEINSYLSENKARYELIEFEQSQDLVYDVIDENYNRTLQARITQAEAEGKDTSGLKGDIWTIAQAADKVEQALEQKYDKARNLSKVQALLSPRAVVPPTATKPQLSPRQPQKTLNNTLSATPAAPRKTPRTDEERIAAAIAYAKGLRPTA
jgi:hypothetical protein